MSQDLSVHVIPILEDNYTYYIHSRESDRGVLVDPGEATVVLDFLHEKDYPLNEIWITHFHSDHIGGIEMIQDATRCQVIVPEKERDKIPHATQTVGDLDVFEMGSHPVKVLEVPGHTMGHVAYWLYQDDMLFCGDTLFNLGCGYLFEGTYKDMWSSLLKLRNLPPLTRIYAGHEYTEQNGLFAKSIDPDNEDLNRYLEEVKTLRAENKPTYPSTLKEQVLINPFLRADLPYWKKLLDLPDAKPLEIFEEIRKRKNKFK